MSDALLRATLDLLRDLVAVEQVAVHDRELTAAVERLAKRAQVLLEQADRR